MRSARRGPRAARVVPRASAHLGASRVAGAERRRRRGAGEGETPLCYFETSAKEAVQVGSSACPMKRGSARGLMKLSPPFPASPPPQVESAFRRPRSSRSRRRTPTPTTSPRRSTSTRRSRPGGYRAAEQRPRARVRRAVRSRRALGETEHQEPINRFLVCSSRERPPRSCAGCAQHGSAARAERGGCLREVLARRAAGPSRRARPHYSERRLSRPSSCARVVDRAEHALARARDRFDACDV